MEHGDDHYFSRGYAWVPYTLHMKPSSSVFLKHVTILQTNTEARPPEDGMLLNAVFLLPLMWVAFIVLNWQRERHLLIVNLDGTTNIILWQLLGERKAFEYFWNWWNSLHSLSLWFPCTVVYNSMIGSSSKRLCHVGYPHIKTIERPLQAGCLFVCSTVEF